MAISIETQNFILSVVDANQEYNTKIIFFCLFFLYLIFFVWWSNRLIPFNATREQRSKFPIYQQAGVKVLRLFSVTFLAFLPLIIPILMYRLYDIDNLITLLVTGYTIMTMIGFVVFIMFGFQWVNDFLALTGINLKEKQSGRLIRRKDR